MRRLTLIPCPLHIHAQSYIVIMLSSASISLKFSHVAWIENQCIKSVFYDKLLSNLRNDSCATLCMITRNRFDKFAHK